MSDDKARPRRAETIGKILCDAFGLDGSTVRRIELVVEVGEPTFANVTHIVRATDAGLETLATKLAKYEVREVTP